MRCESPHKMAKTFNKKQSFVSTIKTSKLTRSKSAFIKQNEIKSFEDKISFVIRKQFSATFSDLKKDFQRLS